nr:septal ring lytic transglycosylase RlpA family protein [Rickettsia endosymbiont of Ceutorhynchus assimilis]
MIVTYNKLKLLIFLILCFGLVSCNTSKQHLYKNLSKDDPHNLSYQGHYKVGKSYKIKGKTYKPQSPNKSYTQLGIASWYGTKGGFHGKKTANGDKYNKNLLTAAHKTLPLPCLIKVTNQANNKSVILMVNDRGPFKKNRIVDVSEKAAEILKFKKQGIAKVKVEYLAHETDKFLKNIKLKPQENFIVKRTPKKRTSTTLASSKCSVNCHIKLVNLKHNLALTP